MKTLSKAIRFASATFKFETSGAYYIVIFRGRQTELETDVYRNGEHIYNVTYLSGLACMTKARYAIKHALEEEATVRRSRRNSVDRSPSR